MNEYEKAIKAWRDQAARDQQAKLSETYRACEPGQETPEAIEAMDELARVARERQLTGNSG